MPTLFLDRRTGTALSHLGTGRRATTLAASWRATEAGSDTVNLYVVETDESGRIAAGVDLSSSGDKPALKIAAERLTQGEGAIVLTFGGDATHPLELAGIDAAKIETRLNQAAAVISAGRVDVDEIPGDGSTRAFRVRFRSVGARAAITSAITGDLPPATAALTVMEEGGASAAETVLLVLAPRKVAAVETSAWTALSAPTVAITTLATGSASVSSTFRIAVGTSAAALPRAYHFRILVGGQTTARIATDASAADIEDAISDALGSVGLWRVKKTGAHKWEVAKAAVGVATMTLTDSWVDAWPGLTGTLALDSAACIALISGNAQVMARATIESGTGEMIYRETLPLRAAVEGLGQTSPIILARTVTSASAPTTGDDSADGYGLFSLWINTSTDAAYILTDNTEGAALWVALSGAGGAFGTLVSVPANEDDSGSNGDYSFDGNYFYKYYPAPVAKWRRTGHDAF